MHTSSNTRTVANLAAPFLLGWFLVGTTGFDLLPGIGVFNGKRVLEILTLLLIIGFTLINGRTRESYGEIQSLVPRWVTVSILACVVLGTISALRFSHPGYALVEIGLPVLLVLCTFATAAAYRTSAPQFDRLAVLVVITVGLIAAVTEITGLMVDWSLGLEFGFNKMLIRFAHPRFYNQLQTYCIPLIAALPFVFRFSRRLQVLSVSLLGLQWCLLLMSGGRGSVVGISLALAAAAFLFPSTRRAWLGIHLAGLLLGGILFLGVHSMHRVLAPEGGTFIEESVGRSMTHSSGRVQMWQLAWSEALEHPFLGSGPSRYACDSPPTTPSHPHSLPFRFLAEWGIPVFLMVMLVLAWLVWLLVFQSRKQVTGRHPPDILAAMLCSSMLAAGLHACVSGLLIMPASQIMTILVGGWALGRLTLPAPEIQTRNSGHISLLAGLTLAIVISGFSITELKAMGVRTQNVQNAGYLMPRYWHWGRSCQYVYSIYSIKTKQ
jgi:hypothetical protein